MRRVKPVAQIRDEESQKKDVDPLSPIAGFRGPTTETGKSTPKETWSRPSSVEINSEFAIVMEYVCLNSLVCFALAKIKNLS